MRFSLFSTSQSLEVIDLFGRVFSASEGEEEGRVIANFVSRLIDTTKPEDLIGCIAEDGDSVVGCIFFSRFIVPNDQVSYILSPVAISTDSQGRGKN